MNSQIELIRVVCPNLKCQATISISKSARGKNARCNGCMTLFKVPIMPAMKYRATKDDEIAILSRSSLARQIYINALRTTRGPFWEERRWTLKDLEVMDPKPDAPKNK